MTSDDDFEAREPFDLSDKYWALLPPYSEGFASEALDRVEGHHSTFFNNAVGRSIFQSYRQYYSMDMEGELDGSPLTELVTSGESGEFLYMNSNHYRNLIRHQRALITGDRPAWDPMAINDDAESLRQVELARNILDFTIERQMGDAALELQTETSLVCGAGWMELGWEALTNPMTRARGALTIRNLTPMEVTHDKVADYRQCSWWITRGYAHKWSLAAHLAKSDPDKARAVAEGEGGDRNQRYQNLHAHSHSGGDDHIVVYRVYIPPNPAAPQGRFAIITADGFLVHDLPFPYDEAPVYRMAPSEFLGTAVPYGDSWDLMAIQQAYNAVLGMVLTRCELGGVPTIAATEGSEVGIEELFGGRMISLAPGMEKPGVVELLSLPSVLPSVLDFLQKLGETLSGINSVNRGSPQDNIKSGSMAALVEQASLRFNAPAQRAHVHNQERFGSGVLKIYRRFADEKQLLEIAGQDQVFRISEFTKDDLRYVERVRIKKVNAYGKTAAGKMDIAEKMLANQMFKHPSELINLVNTGNFEPLFSDATAEIANIKSENEKMLKGKRPRSLMVDNHRLHIQEHKVLLDSKGRDNPHLVDLVMSHIQEHVQQATQLTMRNPGLLMLTDQEPVPMPMMPPGPGGGPPPPSDGDGKEKKAKGPLPGIGSEVEGKLPDLPEPAEPPKGSGE